MNTRQLKLKQTIARSRGVAESEAFFSQEFNDPAPFAESARALMSEVPPAAGSCVMLSCAWASYLQEKYSIPAIVVAGDLKIAGARVFKYKEKLPEPRGRKEVVRKSWSGHCWIEVNGLLGDLSIFRTAYSLGGDSILKNYILEQFGPDRGALLNRIGDLPKGMQYIPQYVLKDSQVEMFFGSLSYQLHHGT